MTESYPRPKIAVSRCLGFEVCRYDGTPLSCDFVSRLAEYCDVQTVCPEMSIGLGMPRDPVKIVATTDGGRALYQQATDADLTEHMTTFASEWVVANEELDGAILKSRSPSCGVRDVSVRRQRVGRAIAERRTSGFFADAVLGQIGGRAVESEARLEGVASREHFLTKLFCLAGFRRAREAATREALQGFVIHNAWMFRAYNLLVATEYDRVLEGDHSGPAIDWEYCQELVERAFARRASRRAHCRVIRDALDGMSLQMSLTDHQMIDEQLLDYRKGRVFLHELLATLRVWLHAHHVQDLLQQSYFDPYPAALLE